MPRWPSRRAARGNSPITSGSSRWRSTSSSGGSATCWCSDLDGDRTADIIVANNARSRIDLLLSSRRAADEEETRPFRKEANDLESDRRMRLVSIPVNKEVVSLDTGDFNGDGKPDLVYYGTPAEVEILFNEGPGKFGNSKKINTGEAVEAPGALAVGDLDQDGRDDIALLAENDLIFVYQTSPGVLTEPERVPHTASSPQDPQARRHQWRQGSGRGDPGQRARTIRSTSASRPPRRSSAPSSDSRWRGRGPSPSARSTARGARRS